MEINPSLLYLLYRDYLVRILKPSQQDYFDMLLFSHYNVFGAYLSGHIVKNGMSSYTYTFPNPTNPFFFGSGGRSGTIAQYVKNVGKWYTVCIKKIILLSSGSLLFLQYKIFSTFLLRDRVIPNGKIFPPFHC